MSVFYTDYVFLQSDTENSKDGMGKQRGTSYKKTHNQNRKHTTEITFTHNEDRKAWKT